MKTATRRESDEEHHLEEDTAEVPASSGKGDDEEKLSGMCPGPLTMFVASGEESSLVQLPRDAQRQTVALASINDDNNNNPGSVISPPDDESTIEKGEVAGKTVFNPESEAQEQPDACVGCAKDRDEGVTDLMAAICRVLPELSQALNPAVVRRHSTVLLIEGGESQGLATQQGQGSDGYWPGDTPTLPHPSQNPALSQPSSEPQTTPTDTANLVLLPENEDLHEKLQVVEPLVDVTRMNKEAVGDLQPCPRPSNPEVWDALEDCDSLGEGLRQETTGLNGTGQDSHLPGEVGEDPSPGEPKTVVGVGDLECSQRREVSGQHETDGNVKGELESENLGAVDEGLGEGQQETTRDPGNQSPDTLIQLDGGKKASSEERVEGGVPVRNSGTRDQNILDKERKIAGPETKQDTHTSEVGGSGEPYYATVREGPPVPVVQNEGECMNCESTGLGEQIISDDAKDLVVPPATEHVYECPCEVEDLLDGSRAAEDGCHRTTPDDGGTASERNDCKHRLDCCESQPRAPEPIYENIDDRNERSDDRNERSNDRNERNGQDCGKT